MFDTKIYARAMGLQSSVHNLDTTMLMGHELSPILTSMFDENGNLRDAKTKSNPKNALNVEVSRRLAEQDVQATFLDGCAVLWVVPWPTSGTVHDYLVWFRSYIHGHLAKSDIYLVFDKQGLHITLHSSPATTKSCLNRHHKQRSIDCSHRRGGYPAKF